MLVTIRPAQESTSAQTLSLPNIHGDVMATLDGNGTLIDTHMTGPYGEELANKANPWNTEEGTTYGYVGQHQKSTESEFSIPVIQMGARVYLPTIGRFASIVPIEDGTDNNYAYTNQPVTEFDLDGKIAWVPLAGGVAAACLKLKKLCKVVVKKAATNTRKVAGGAGRWVAKNDPVFGYKRGILNKGQNRIGFSRCKSHVCFRWGKAGKHQHQFSVRTPIKWKGQK